MQFYGISDIHKQKIEYPPQENIEFLSLSEYLDLSECIIASRIKNKGYRGQILKNEDAISHVANAIMMADWRYDESKSKGLTRPQYRNYCGYLATRYILTKSYQKKEDTILSLQFVDRCDGMLENKIIVDEPQPIDNLIRKEEYEILHDLIEESGLSESQKKCVELRLNNESFESIGQKTGITRQAAHHKFNVALKKLKNHASNL